MPKSMSPFSQLFGDVLRVAAEKWNTTRGFSLCIFVASRATKGNAKGFAAPDGVFPPAHSSGAASSACVFSYRASISSARFCSKNPASVSSIFLLPRTKSCLPNSFSKFCICREKAGLRHVQRFRRFGDALFPRNREKIFQFHGSPCPSPFPYYITVLHACQA